jgi:aryl-alcohol dehydrogenase-like predicted oxidoreductase
MTKQSVAIGGSNVFLSRIGFGCARIFGRSELKASTRLIEAALSAGIRHFDTAPSYGNGLSEEVLGIVLAGVDDVTIATKVGIDRPAGVAGPYSTEVMYRRFARPLMSYFPRAKARLLQLASQAGGTRGPESSPRRHLSREEVLCSLDESLKQLRRNRADLLLIHEPDQFQLTDEVKEVFAELQGHGAVGAFGLAYGRVAYRGLGFGTVVQGRYAADQPRNDIKGETSIFHGILRRSAEEHKAVQSAGSRIRQVLDIHPNAAIIFSASTPVQIRGVMQQLRQCTVMPYSALSRAYSSQ